MGSYITLGIGRMELDWGKNRISIECTAPNKLFLI